MTSNEEVNYLFARRAIGLWVQRLESGEASPAPGRCREDRAAGAALHPS